MIDWLTILIALAIIAALVSGFGFLAWKMNMSDPLLGEQNNQLTESSNDKRRKEKHASEQSKKKRKDQRKPKRENKDDEEKQSKRTKPLQTSEETDDEREESEQELLTAPAQTVETSGKARKRNKNKNNAVTPLPSSTTPSESTTKNPLTTRAPPATHSKSASKEELESTKQQTKVQTSNKPTTTAKKPTETVQKQPQEQPFTVVGGNRHKTATPSAQQNKPQVNVTAAVQQSSTTPTQRPPLPQRETQAPVAVPTPDLLPIKQTSAVPPKIADLIKALPSSQAVVTELMTALDAFALTADELDIIMHKIANKQSVVKQDWSKLQQGQKVDPQAHIGQALDESAKAYEDNAKTNSVKHIQELTNQLHAEKRRNNDLLREKNDKEREIQILHAQLDSVQYKHEPSTTAPASQKLQILELELKRLTDENALLTRQVAQQLNTSNSDASNMKVQVLSEQMKKLSVDNANWEKKANSNELLAKEAQKEKDNLIRANEQLIQSLQAAQKDLKQVDEKHHQQLNESRNSHLNEINECKVRIEQLEKDNEQLKREEIVHIEPSTATDIQTLTVNNEEREQFENEIERLRRSLQSRENEFREEIERLKQDQQQQADESRNNELNALRTELNEVKATLSQSQDRLREEREKQQHLLADFLPQDLRNQLPSDNQDFAQWLSSYRQVFESSKRHSQEEIEALQRENAQVHKNMTDIENQLRDIEKTVQSKEETLLTELKSKDAAVENLRGENDQLTNELQHLRREIQTLRSNHDASVSEARALKLQLDERFLVAANSPSIATADESFELLKQPSPSLSPVVVDVRAEQSNEMIRSSKEAPKSQQLNDMPHSEHEETSASASSNQQS